MAFVCQLIKPLKYRQFFAMAAKNVSSTSKLLSDAAEELKTNPFYEKYAGKIADLQKTSPEEFLKRFESNSDTKKPEQLKSQRELSPGLAKSLQNPQQQYTKPKLLNDIMKTELLIEKSADDIKQIWLDYHKNKDVIAAVIPSKTYDKMLNRGKEFSTFLLPLPRNQGYEFIVCQFYGNEIHFTPLIAYQTHKENAPECLTMVHYTEFSNDKGIVLMKGEYNTDILQSHEAQCLINELQLYYAHDNEKRLKILHRFTYSPEEFKHMDLIAEVECLSL